MKIVITGGHGQLGRDCWKVLRDKHTVHAYGSGEFDITNPEQTETLLRGLRPDVIINCAAYTAVDKCEEERERCMLVNGQGPGILAREAAGLKAKLIHISTDYVFDGRKLVPEPYREEDPVSPISMYGKSKLAGEQNIGQELENHLIIRTAWLYGLDGNNFLKTMLRLSRNHPKKTLKVVNDQYGSLTWTYRLALQIERLLDSDLTGTIHATAEGSSTWYQGAKTFLESMGVAHSIQPCTTEEYPTPARRPANSILENGILKAEGLNIMRPWDEDVREFAGMFRDQLLS